MAQRILVLEKDTNFLRELEAGFSRYGAAVEVVADAEASVARAKAEPTALVLLSADAMNAPGEAFLVCKRFKSDDELSRIPFVIMGGSQHVESFESHKKLKRRADEYVKLPVGFDDLVSKLSPLVPLSAVNGSAGAEAGEPEVDADIDAFADNAFDDLLVEEAPKPAAKEPAFEPPRPVAAAPAAPPVKAAPPAPAPVAAAPAASNEEVSRLKAQIEQLNARAKSAEERAEGAEKRAMAQRASVPPPGAGVSSREYLEMREQLNRKDKEILSLRDEVTTRDRQLLDQSDKALELERAQANLHEDLGNTQRQLEDAQNKIKAYETDRDVVSKRLEDLKSRLTRAEDKGKKLEGELDSIKNLHASETAELKSTHERKLHEIESAVAGEVARMRADHAAKVGDMEQANAAALASLESRSQQELAEERALRENEVAALKAAHARASDDLRAEQQRALAEQRSAADAALQRALAEAQAAQDRALEEALGRHAEELSLRLGEADRVKTAALEGLRKELESKQAVALKEAEDKHGKELAILGRKLSEAESRAALLEERLEDSEQSRQELETTLRAQIGRLEGDLKARTEERDRAQNEMSAARARIDSLARTEAQQSARIIALEEQLSAAVAQGERQRAKIAADDELLERVRKALGIGLGLLDQQRQNVAEEA